MRPKRRKLLFFVTEDYYFVSHRLPLAMAARDAGYDVSVITRVRRDGETIVRSGVRLLPLENVRGSINPLRDLAMLWRLVKLYRRERPDIAHHVAMKPVIYGTIAARIAGTRHLVNGLAGMGWLFTSGSGIARALQPAVRAGLRWALNRGTALIQNDDDAILLRQLGVDPARIRQIGGVGVDVGLFCPAPAPAGDVVVLFPARLLWDKGIGEFIDAARALKAGGTTARFVIAGEPDSGNPASVSPEQLHEWLSEGIVDYRGWVADMPKLLAESHVVCLPSYREGFPKSLIEAAAAGRPIVTTDVPGCRAVVRNGDNGLLVPARDSAALGAALGRLIDDAPARQRMGARSRERAEREFALGPVLQQHLALYEMADA